MGCMGPLSLGGLGMVSLAPCYGARNGLLINDRAEPTPIENLLKGGMIFFERPGGHK